MKGKRGRYSGYLKPIFAGIDIVIINILVFLFAVNIQDNVLFLGYITLSWLILSFRNAFYDIRRYSKITHIISLLFVQFAIFSLMLYAFIGFFKQPNMSRLAMAKYLVSLFFVISFFKIFFFFLLKKYRKFLGGNSRRVVVIGDNHKTHQLIAIFRDREEFGYKFQQQFCVADREFSLKNTFEYINANNIDEIYCSIAELSDIQLKKIVNFADNNLKVLKFIPDNKEIFTKKMIFDYYDYVPVLSFREIPLDDTVNKITKRTFDIILALFVLIFILSWLTPIIAILMQLESKGPVFFKQRRNGMNYGEFYCFKYRSMKFNTSSNQATKGDDRITRIGKFMRKTSIDELPQFLNVLKGDMSVVGPRPHMVKHNENFSQKVDKFMVRHFVKPGITGLAQISGFRGEIETNIDIVNRVKYDIFYIENWSLLLDIKIVVLTVVNTIKGEEKAY